MLRRCRPIVLAATLLALASPAAAASGASGAPSDGPLADHLGGTFTACGRIVEFTAPMVGTDGSLTISGIVNIDDHAFVIDEGATIDPLVSSLAASGDWTCLALTGDGMGILIDIAVGDAEVCGPLAMETGSFVLLSGSTDEFMSVVLDGEAGALVAADPALDEPLSSIAMTPGAGEACLEFQLAADGTLAAIFLDYALAPAACGMVNGTPIPYRDPASQPYPEGTEVGVAGYFVDASLLSGPHLAVLSFHLDAIAEVCLLVEIEDNAVLSAAVRSPGDTEVCGELEVVGGLVNVGAVVVSQGLTGINFASPSPASIALACWSARALPAGVDGLVIMCGDFEGADAPEQTFTVSGVTFRLETAIDDSDLPPEGGPQAIAVIGPDPFQPFGPANPTRLTTATVDGCAGGSASPPPLPDTRAGAAHPAGSLAGLVLVLAGVALTIGAIPRVRRLTRR
jgi:hypothetical protein